MSQAPLPSAAFSPDTPPKGVKANLDDLLTLRLSAKGLTLNARVPTRSSGSGNRRTRQRGRGMEFEEVRIYQPGDDIRTIDWRVTARTQVPHTKLFREEREKPVILCIDQRASLYFGSHHCFKSVTAMHLAACFAWSALERGDRVGAIVFSDHDEREIRPKRSRHTVLSILREALQFNQKLSGPAAEKAVPLSERLTELRRLAKPGSSVVIISDFYHLDDAAEEQLLLLARHCDIHLAWVNDPLEAKLPAVANLVISDGVHRKKLNGGDQRVQMKLQDWYANHRARIEQISVALAAPLVAVSTEDAPLTALHSHYLKTGGKR